MPIHSYAPLYWKSNSVLVTMQRVHVLYFSLTIRLWLSLHVFNVTWSPSLFLIERRVVDLSWLIVPLNFQKATFCLWLSISEDCCVWCCFTSSSSVSSSSYMLVKSLGISRISNQMHLGYTSAIKLANFLLLHVNSNVHSKRVTRMICHCGIQFAQPLNHIGGVMGTMLASSVVDRGFIGGVMGSKLASSVVDRGFEPRSGQTKDYEIGICYFSTKHATLRRKS